MIRSIVALSLAAGMCAASLEPATAGRGGGFGGGFHGGFGGFHGGFGCCGGWGWWGPGVAFGLGYGLGYGAPYYYPPYNYPPPVGYYPPPQGYQQGYYQPPPQAYSQAPGCGGQSCYAGAYVCPMDRPVASGAGCYCPGNNGQRVGGRAS
jgi:hypothetical protein